MNITKIRQDFPVLEKGIIYFDSACMALKPVQVINKINEYYNDYPACAGRSYHKLSKKVTDEVEKTRTLLKKFVGAKKYELIFTKNTTEAINLVANSLKIKSVLLSDREHNSNLLPWMKFKHDVVNVDEDLEDYKSKVKDFDLISVVFTSNLDGYTLPVKEIIKIAHENGKLVLLDGAQAMPHKEINISRLDADFLAFSGHKMLGPTGTGGLFGKKELLEKMDPFMLGGETVSNSSYDKFDLLEVPQRFEAGLQNYAGIVGLSEAVNYLKKIGLKNIEAHEKKLVKFLVDNLDVDLVGINEGNIFNFNVGKMGSHEVAQILDHSANIAVRSGMHCVHSWFNARKLKGSVRASVYLYNTKEECERFVEEVNKIKQLNS